MRELFRTDLKRVFKDKLLMVLGILAVVFALMMPLLYAAIAAAEEFMELGLTNGLYAKNLFFQSFFFGNKVVGSYIFVCFDKTVDSINFALACIVVDVNHQFVLLTKKIGKLVDIQRQKTANANNNKTG